MITGAEFRPVPDRCGECGQAVEAAGLVVVGCTPVCAACKLRALALLVQGAPVGQADRQQAHVTELWVRLPPGVPLPFRCVFCNAPAVTQVAQTFHPPFPIWLLPMVLAPFLGLSLSRWSPRLGLIGGAVGLGGLVASVFLHPRLSRNPATTLQIPLCHGHQRSRVRWLRWSLGALLMGLLLLLATLFVFWRSHIPWPWLQGSVFLVLAGALATAIRLRLVTLEPGPGRCLQIRGAGDAFRASLPRTTD